MTKTTFTVKRDELKVMIEREYIAQCESVFKLYTDPALIPEWWGPRSFTTTVEKMDVRVGGAWRFVQHDQAGTEFAFNGVYKEVNSPEKLVYTFEFEGKAGHILTETVIFADLGGKTRVICTDVFANGEDLDGMVNSGMETGAIESLERLAEIVEKRQAI